jgi:hypothetical protein
VDVEQTGEQASSEAGRKRYERDRIAWNLPAPKVRTVVRAQPDPAPLSEEPETSDELEPDPAPAAS